MQLGKMSESTVESLCHTYNVTMVLFQCANCGLTKAHGQEAPRHEANKTELQVV